MAGAAKVVDDASHSSERLRVPLPPAVDGYVRTGERGRDAFSSGNMLPFSRFEGSEFSAGASAVPLVFREDAAARGDGWADPRARADEAEDAAARRSSI